MMALLGPFARDRKVVVGVSGGADSMALALLLRHWGEPLAVIVDHGLRRESHDEAALTQDRLRDLGIPAVIVAVAGLQPGGGLSARARAARYDALFQICREHGRPDLLVAHHRQDQAETVRLRAASGSGRSGLAGMASIAWRGPARILRPLLGTDPARLRATLRRDGVAWVEDPGNRDPKHGPGRLAARPCRPGGGGACRRGWTVPVGRRSGARRRVGARGQHPAGRVCAPRRAAFARRVVGAALDHLGAAASARSGRRGPARTGRVGHAARRADPGRSGRPGACGDDAAGRGHCRRVLGRALRPPLDCSWGGARNQGRTGALAPSGQASILYPADAALLAPG